MTLVEPTRHREAGTSEQPAERLLVSRLWRCLGWLARRSELPWAGVAGLAVWLLVLAGHPVTDPVLYGLYWTVAIAVPGVLLQRALMGSRTLPEDLGLGAVMGLAWQLVGWVVLTGLQVQSLLWAWPIGLVAVFAAVPKLRKHWGVRERTPLGWSWAAAASMTVAVLVLHLSWLSDIALPPHTRLQEPDLWYHMAINGELTRTILPDLPYVAGQALEYHWFPNVHLVTGQLMTGIAPGSILLHLWLVPMLVTFFLLVFGLSRALARSWWPGVVAATLTVSLPAAIAITPANVGGGVTPMVYASPSSVYAGTVMIALSLTIIRILRGGCAPGVWVSAGILTLLGAGTKPTILPLALTGTAVVAVYLAVRRRSVTPALSLLAVLAGGLVLGGLMVTGGVAGSEIRLFGYFRSIKGFRIATGDDSVIGVTGSWVVPGVLESGLAGWLFAAALLAALILFHLPSLLGTVGVFLPATRGDVGVWWLAGVGIAAFGPFLVIDHMGGSQKYFLLTAFPLSMVLSVHVFASYVPRNFGAALRRSAVGVLLCGMLGATVSATALAEPRWLSIGTATESLLLGVGLFVVMAGLVVLGCHRFATGAMRPGYAVTLLGVLVLGWSLPHALSMTIGQLLERRPLTVAADGPVLAPGKQRAALWLASHTDPDDTVITNAHCFRHIRGVCDARAFSISALSGRRVYLEGWGYTPANALTRTLPRRNYMYQPSPWPHRLRQSDAAVTAPTRQLLDGLARHHNVRWVYADKGLDEPAPALHDLATLRYENRDVAIFELARVSPQPTSTER